MEDLSEFHEMRLRKDDGFFGVIAPIVVRLKSTDAQTAANYTTCCFTANRNYEIVEVTERHEVAADAGTLTVKRVANGVAPASGESVLIGTISLTATADTLQFGQINDTNRFLAKNSSLSLETTGALTNLVGVTVTIVLRAI